MAYPSVPISVGLNLDLIDDLRFIRGQQGSAFSIASSVGTKNRFTVVHVNITAAQKATLDAFYLANRGNTFDFVWVDGVTYVCAFAAPFNRSIPKSAILFTVTTKLEEL